MRIGRFIIPTIASVVALLLTVNWSPVWSAAQGAAALVGSVASDAEGAMEGVVVSVRRTGSIVTVSVVSDDKGNYRFPADRLEPGQYSIMIRAVGYDLDGPATADVVANKVTTADLRLKKTADSASQLTSSEWIDSVPGDPLQKRMLLSCAECHTLERVFRTHYNASQWMSVIQRMRGWAYVSFALKPQLLNDPNRRGQPGDYRVLADFLARANLSTASTWQYAFKTRPRPKGRATHVIVTEYSLPRTDIQPHDVIVDRNGIVWYADFGGLQLGKFDPKTLKLTEYQIKENKPGFPVGELDVELDPYNGTIWFDMMFQAAIGNFDPKTEKFVYYPLPKQYDDINAQINFLGLNHLVDNKVWTKNAHNLHVYQVDVANGGWKEFNPTMDRSYGAMDFYQGLSDSKNNFWVSEMGSGHIAEINGKTGQTKWFSPPTPNSGPRRMLMDRDDVLWFAEFDGDNVGRLDTKTGKFTEWPLPPWNNPYRVVVDRNGEVWASTMETDRVVRLNPKTNEATQYLMPFETNMRSAFVDNSTARPTFWVGSNHGAALIKVEPLD